MEVVLTAVLVVLTGYQFYHPSVESGAYSAVVHNGQVYRLNTRDGSFDKCEPPTMTCSPASLQIKQEFKPEVSEN